MSTILAIDPGIEKIGYAIFASERRGDHVFKASGLIHTSSKDSTEVRLRHIYDHITAVIDLHRPQTVVLEQLFYFKNQKTFIRVSQAQGVLMLASAQKSVPVHFIAPLQIKLAVTGDGRATKQALVKMLSLSLGKDVHTKEDDESDAIACGLAYCLIKI